MIRAHETVSNGDPWAARLSDVSASSAGSRYNNLTMRLPKMKIDKFDADVSLWQVKASVSVKVKEYREGGKKTQC